MTPHLNRLDETFQMRGHNVWFYAELTKILPNYHQILPLILSSGAQLEYKARFVTSVSCPLRTMKGANESVMSSPSDRSDL